jgi:metallothionein
MSGVDSKKCAHPACACVAGQHDKYCSQSCKESADLTEIACQCGHPACESSRAIA